MRPRSCQCRAVPRPLSRFGRLVAGLALVLTGGASAPAHADDDFDFGTSAPPPYGDGWLQLEAGLTFTDVALLDEHSTLDSVGTPAFVVAVGAIWRTPALDLGVRLEALGSFQFQGLPRDNRVGPQFRAVANLRWRYVEDDWGALFVRLTPGVAVLSHADPLRFQASQAAGGDFDAVDRYNLGFTVGFDFGVLVYLSNRIALVFDMDLVSATTSIGTHVRDVDLTIIRGVFTAGLEWRM